MPNRANVSVVVKEFANTTDERRRGAARADLLRTLEYAYWPIAAGLTLALALHAQAAEPKVPILHSTDLCHPHDDRVELHHVQFKLRPATGQPFS